MKEQIYLVSQLPSLWGAAEKGVIPITENYYRDLCSRFFDEKQKAILDAMSLEAPKLPVLTGSAFLDKWYEAERALRYALASVRASKLKKDFGMLPVSVTADIIQAARTAVGMEDPLKAEEFLYTYRMSYLDSIEPRDMFSCDSVFAYGIRLMLLIRMKSFDKDRGESSYHKIYDTILGDAK